ncbi:MAG: reactive intermediate/imine deaminase [marine bacterium B5-7]|nr:MAG: reactive intermediate/imine deaminase [marine bacterium B5-7]
MRQVISTNDAPSAIGTYSQAVRTGNTVYISGQIPLDPATMEVVEGDIDAMIRRVFDSLKAVTVAATGTLDQVARMTIYLTDLNHFPLVNEVMAEYFDKPYPARVAVGVAALPKGVPVEIDAIVDLSI